MKNRFVLPFLVLLLLAAACSKTNNNPSTPPDQSRVVNTLEASELSQHSIRLNGSVFWEEGKGAATKLYFLLIDKASVNKGDAQLPTPAQMVSSGAKRIDLDESFSGAREEHSFYCDVTDLKYKTLYFYCAVADFSGETLYGSVRSASTLAPEITGLAVKDVTATSMTVSFSYEGDDVTSVRLDYEDIQAETKKSTTDYTVANSVYSFKLEGLDFYTRYSLDPVITTTDGWTLTDSIIEFTQKGISILSAEKLSATSFQVKVHLWPRAGVPTLYFTTDSYLISNDYTSAQHVTMNRIAEPGKAENYGRNFSVNLVNLTAGKKYYFLAQLDELKTEVSSIDL